MNLPKEILQWLFLLLWPLMAFGGLYDNLPADAGLKHATAEKISTDNLQQALLFQNLDQKSLGQSLSRCFNAVTFIPQGAVAKMLQSHPEFFPGLRDAQKTFRSPLGKGIPIRIKLYPFHHFL